MKRLLTIALVFILALSMLTACSGNSNAPSSSNTPLASQGADSTPPGGNGGSGSVFIPGDKDEIITFQFEDAEHMQAVLAWLKTVLYAEDYYAFVDGEDYDVPYDFEDESPIWLEEEE